MLTEEDGTGARKDSKQANQQIVNGLNRCQEDQYQQKLHGLLIFNKASANKVAKHVI